MISAAGIDISSKAIDIVLLDETTDLSSWHHLELQGTTAFDRLRDLPNRMPGSTWWEDMGVYICGIEAPYGRAQAGTLAKLSRVFGAVAAALPPTLTTVWEVPPHDWRRELQLPGNAPKDVCAAKCIQLGAYPEWADQNAYDAYAVARYCREVNRRAIEAA